MAPFSRFRYFQPILLGGFVLTIFSTPLVAQQSANSAYFNLKKLTAFPENKLIGPAFRVNATNLLRAGTSLGTPDGLPALLPTLALCRWSAEDLPFFCRIEHKLGLKTQVPIKFRLGSVEYVDWLEGKLRY